VKIDRSFVGPIAREQGTTAIVHRVVELCHDLGIKSIAEGVETSQQANVLRDLGCTHGQGYLFGRPGRWD
jgi:EAL domain-containing protein (putative c-di-GMP-specific phosphodiesterase class I)